MNSERSTSITLALTLLNAGQVERCLAELEGCRRDDSDPLYVRLRAEALFRLGRWNDLDDFLAGLHTVDPPLTVLAALFSAKALFHRGLRQDALLLASECGTAEDPQIDGLLAQFRATCEARLGLFDAAAKSLRRAIADLEQCRDGMSIAQCLNDLGNIERVRGSFDLAESCYRRASDAAAEYSSVAEMGRSALNLAALHLVQGKLYAATREYEKAIALSREAVNRPRTALACLGLGLALCRRSEPRGALRSFLDARRLIRESGAPRHHAILCEYLGELRLAEARFENARRLLRRAAQIGRGLGDPEAIYEPQYRLAEAELALRNTTVARSLAVESRDNFAARGDRLEAAFAGRVAAQALLCDGKWQEAIKELTEIEQTLDQLGEQFEIDRVRRLLDAARSRTKVWDIRLEERVRHLVPETKVAPLKDATCVDPAIICGKSRRFLEFLEQVDQHCRRPLPVLLEGETGVGKELIAHRIHARSDRSGGAFVPFNCGTASPGLFDAEIFGYVKGAFTGADAGRRGLARVAHAGTLFLDEIGEMGRESQARILRLLDSGEVRPVGSDRIERTDIRLIAATHQDLHALVDNGSFRRDLFYRLRTVHLKVPALRERIEDLELLVQHFLDQAQARAIGTPTGVSDAVFEEMSRYPWPGNVRELRNEIFRLASEYDGKLIRKWSMRPTPTLIRSGATPRDLTEEEVTSALQRTQGSVAEAARLLDVSRNGIYRAVSRLGLDLASFRRN